MKSLFKKFFGESIGKEVRKLCQYWEKYKQDISFIKNKVNNIPTTKMQ